jgi:selenocysteine lyase/cysteine desulfurase
LGVLYGRYELLDQLRAYKVRPADDVPPHKFEAGTKNHEGLAGTKAAINYLADLGAEFGAPFANQYPEFEGRRLHLKTAMAATRAYERPLAERLIAGLEAIPDVTFYGITDPFGVNHRAPTVAFTLEGYSPRQAAERLGGEGIFVWETATTTRWPSPRGWGWRRAAVWCGWGLLIITRWRKSIDC